MAIDVSSLIDTPNGLISRRIFVERELYEQELQNVFARTWLFLAHDTMIPNPGDFFATYMGEDPVIVIRDSAGKVNAFINSCRHRGMKVCRADQGNAASFTCAYHGWTYGNDGKLIGVPNFQDAYFEQLDMEQWGLVPVAQVDSYKGLWFGNFDPTAPSLLEYLGDMAWYLDMLVDRREGGAEIVGATHKWILPANWKFAADNFVGDTLHFQPSHMSTILVQAFSSSAGDPSARVGFEANAGYGHGLIVNQAPARIFNIPVVPELTAYEQQVLPELEERLGATRANISPIVATVFPNFSPFWGRATIRVWHPRGPDKTEVWAWCFVDKAAPPEIKDSIRLNYLRTFGPGGMAEEDDMENWQYCTRTSSGTVTRRYPLNYQLALGHGRLDEEFPGWASQMMSENNARGFYDCWREFMQGHSWDQITEAIVKKPAHA
ncbi:MAG TPA: aromatic ring-hydroxylating dioxygenase subunit alpha [Dehalococcoidia bacterium]|nr:aromatic ring-hydroxylating dioxygenase subunit alpha [Dehalococcoidia bacterium]